MEGSPTHPRRRFQFSLRTLLVLIIIIALPLAWISRERHQSRLEQEIAERLIQQRWEVIVRGPYHSWDLESSGKPQGWWREVARNVLGERVLKVSRPPHELTDASPLVGLTSLQGLSLDDCKISDLTPVSGFTKLRWLWVDITEASDLTPIGGLNKLESVGFHRTNVTDLKPLAGLKRLKWLMVSETNVTDLAPLAGLKELETLDLSDTHITDLSPLAELSKLTQIVALRSSVTKEQLEALQKQIPNCKFTFSPAQYPGLRLR